MGWVRIKFAASWILRHVVTEAGEVIPKLDCLYQNCPMKFVWLKTDGLKPQFKMSFRDFVLLISARPRSSPGAVDGVGSKCPTARLRILRTLGSTTVRSDRLVQPVAEAVLDR